MAKAKRRRKERSYVVYSNLPSELPLLPGELELICQYWEELLARIPAEYREERRDFLLKPKT